MFRKKDIPVYLFTGLLESGKSSFIRETLLEGEFEDGARTLYVMCEEGIEECEQALLDKNKVTVVNGHGSGTYETGVIVEIRANMAKAGMQFLKWEVTEGNVTLANETSPITSFPMPEDAVTVTAVYEDISETSDTGEHLKIIWIGLLVVAIFLAVILLIVRKRLIKEW